MNVVRTQAFVLGRKLYGEARYLVTLLTQDHGLVRAMYTQGLHRFDQGSRVACSYVLNTTGLPKASLEPCDEHLSLTHFMNDPHTYQSVRHLEDIFVLLTRALAPHQPYPRLYEALSQLILQASEGNFDQAYLAFELYLLKILGYGLDLSQFSYDRAASLCTQTGKVVTVQGKGLPVPAFLCGFTPKACLTLPKGCHGDALRQARALTRHMFTTHVCSPQ